MRRRSLRADDRAVSPVVGKGLEATLVVLFVGLLTVTLYGGVVPEYRAAAGDELAERTLAAASQRVEAAVPASTGRVTGRTRVDLPATIAGERYRIRVEGSSLVLSHPDPRVGARSRLAPPADVTRVEGAWRSGRETAVVVRSERGGTVVELVDGGSTP